MASPWPRWGSSRSPSPTGSAPATPARSRRGGRALAGLVAVAIAALATGWWAGPLAAAAVGAAALVAFFAWRAIGGITGDVLGAIEQVAECAVLVVVTGLATDHVRVSARMRVFRAGTWRTKHSGGAKHSDGQEARSAKRRMPSTRSSSPRAKEKRA